MFTCRGLMLTLWYQGWGQDWELSLWTADTCLCCDQGDWTRWCCGHCRDRGWCHCSTSGSCHRTGGTTCWSSATMSRDGSSSSTSPASGGPRSSDHRITLELTRLTLLLPRLKKMFTRYNNCSLGVQNRLQSWLIVCPTDGLMGCGRYVGLVETERPGR